MSPATGIHAFLFLRHIVKKTYLTLICLTVVSANKIKGFDPKKNRFREAVKNPAFCQSGPMQTMCRVNWKARVEFISTPRTQRAQRHEGNASFSLSYSLWLKPLRSALPRFRFRQTGCAGRWKGQLPRNSNRFKPIWLGAAPDAAKNRLKHPTMNDLQYNRGLVGAKPVKVCQSDCVRLRSTSRRRAGMARRSAANSEIGENDRDIQDYSGNMGRTHGSSGEPGNSDQFGFCKRPGSAQRGWRFVNI